MCRIGSGARVRRYAVWMHVVRFTSGFWPYAFFHKLPSLAIVEVCIAGLALQAVANWLVGRFLTRVLRRFFGTLALTHRSTKGRVVDPHTPEPERREQENGSVHSGAVTTLNGSKKDA